MPYKSEFSRRLLTTYLSRFAIFGIILALLAGRVRAEFLYVTNGSGNSISAYRIGESGALTPVAGSPFPAGATPNSVGVDPLGRFVYVVNGDSNDISAYRIGENGALTPVVGSPFPAGGVSGSIVVDPLGRFVYLADFDDSGKGSLSAYRISGNGALTAVPGSPFQIELGYLTVDLSGRFLYGTNGGGISAYRIGGNGALTPVFGSPFQTGFSPYFMAVGP